MKIIESWEKFMPYYNYVATYLIPIADVCIFIQHKANQRVMEYNQIIKVVMKVM